MRCLAAGLLVGAVVGRLVTGCSGDSETEPEPSAFEKDCVALCEFEGDCFGVDVELCTRGCRVLDGDYSSPCRELYATVARCEVSLECEGAQVFADTPRTHAECGTAWTELVTTCGYGNGTPPAACEAFCANAEACAPESFYATCADNCAITLEIAESLYGSDCTATYIDIFACESTLDCAEVQAALEGTPSTTCQSEYLAAGSACQ